MLLSRNLSRFLRRFKHNWVQPSGYDTGIRVYNFLVKDKVPLIVKNKEKITWYTCGPTVYDSAHIGHASCYVKFDLIQRILRQYFQLNLITVMNITDIDDKIIKKSFENNITTLELARKYEKEFWLDMKDLNIKKPDIAIRVTDNIDLISEFITKIIKEEKAYIAKDGSVYFDLNKCKENYGKFVPFPNEEITQNHEESNFKKTENDFAVWKSSKINEPSWQTSFGKGRPGWHSECSALASAVFGNSVDIHAGGIDLRFPHHENEEAISCAHHNKTQWVNYWLHTGYLQLTGDNTKMSKSLKNCVYIRDMLKENENSCDIFRMACAMSHYRSNMEYNNEIMKTAENQLHKFISFINNSNDYINRILPPAEINTNELLINLKFAKLEIDSAYKDDFNTSKVIKILSDLIGVTNKMLHQQKTTNISNDLTDYVYLSLINNLIQEHFNTLGFCLNKKRDEYTNKDQILDILTDFRQNIRVYSLQNKNDELLKYCDSVRDQLKLHGIEIKDRGKISSWNKV